MGRFLRHYGQGVKAQKVPWDLRKDQQKVKGRPSFIAVASVLPFYAVRRICPRESGNPASPFSSFLLETKVHLCA
jgi:hypothetical protein